MLICMKPSLDERENLARRIQRAQADSAFSVSQIASLAGVDPGQTSRILDGKFKTVSGNVVRICNTLGVDPHGEVAQELPPDQAKVHAAWTRLEASVRRAWDETPRGAELLARVIDAIAQVRDR